jgi:hypothetical protein
LSAAKPQSIAKGFAAVRPERRFRSVVTRSIGGAHGAFAAVFLQSRVCRDAALAARICSLAENFRNDYPCQMTDFLSRDLASDYIVLSHSAIRKPGSP